MQDVNPCFWAVLKDGTLVAADGCRMVESHDKSHFALILTTLREFDAKDYLIIAWEKTHGVSTEPTQALIDLHRAVTSEIAEALSRGQKVVYLNNEEKLPFKGFSGQRRARMIIEP